MGRGRRTNGMGGEEVVSVGSTRQGLLWKELAGHRGHFDLQLASVSTKVDGIWFLAR
jgi:hypothetical protein